MQISFLSLCCLLEEVLAACDGKLSSATVISAPLALFLYRKCMGKQCPFRKWHQNSAPKGTILRTIKTVSVPLIFLSVLKGTIWGPHGQFPHSLIKLFHCCEHLCWTILQTNGLVLVFSRLKIESTILRHHMWQAGSPQSPNWQSLSITDAFNHCNMVFSLQELFFPTNRSHLSRHDFFENASLVETWLQASNHPRPWILFMVHSGNVNSLVTMSLINYITWNSLLWRLFSSLISIT